MFPGEKQVYIGIGGGSDCIQAAALAVLGGRNAAVISIRRNKLCSQTESDEIGASRTVENHGGEVCFKGSDVYRITPETTGSGRFVESIPAAHLPTYLVIDRQDGMLSRQIWAAVNDFGGCDSVIALDTGGDCLYRVAQATDVAGQTTPDQDIASLLAIRELQGAALYSCVVATFQHSGIRSLEFT